MEWSIPLVRTWSRNSRYEPGHEHQQCSIRLGRQRLVQVLCQHLLTLRLDDLEAVAQFGQGPKEKERLCQIANELAKRTIRGSLPAYWWLPLDGIGYSDRGNGAVCDVDEVDLFNLSAAAYGLPRHSVANSLTIDLLALEEMTRSLAALFGLTLPSPHKEPAHVNSIKSARSPILEAERATLTAVVENQ